MTAVLASVQSASDATIPPALVVLVVLTACLLIAAWTVPAIVRAWRRANDVIDRAPYPTRISTPRQESSSR